MADQFTEVTTKGWGSRIVDSIKGIAIGLLMFIISFGVLYMNEGRVDVSKIAEGAVEVTSTELALPEMNEQLVYSSGTMTSEEKLGDMFLEAGDYLSVQRNVEMFAWEETSESTSKTNVGGSETTETTYTYSKEWTSNPMDSSSFKDQNGHMNPSMVIESDSATVQSAKFGVYNINMQEVSLPAHIDLVLTDENVILDDYLYRANGKYLFDGYGNIGNPDIGDIRISYSVIANPLNNATIFGKLDTNNQSILPYFGKKDTKLFRVFNGGRDSAISTMSTEYKVITWMLRLVGFLLMWGGMMAMFGPISVVLDVLPIFGSISRGLIGAVTFVVALVLSVAMIIFSMIVHSWIAMLVIMLVLAGLLAGGVFLFLKMRASKKS